MAPQTQLTAANPVYSIRGTDPPYVFDLPSLATWPLNSPCGVRNAGAVAVDVTFNGEIWDYPSQAQGTTQDFTLEPSEEVLFSPVKNQGGINGFVRYVGVRTNLGRATLYGDPDDFAPGSSYTAIENWPDEFSSPQFTVNLATGEITVPVSGIYKISYNVIFQQGNTNKELAIILWLRRSGSPDLVINTQQVSDDKTDVRSFSGSIPAAVAAGTVLQLGISWVNQSVGTIAMSACSFEALLDHIISIS